MAENDGEVVFEDWYIAGEQKDFQEEFAALRQEGFKLLEAAKLADQAVFDSLSAVVLREGSSSDRQFLQLLDVGDIPLAEADETAEDTEVDSTEIFVDTIDGVLLVVEHFDDLQTIAAQLRFQRIKTQLLGNDAWHQPSAIRRLPPNERDNLKGSIFVSGRDSQSNAANEFTKNFRYNLDQDYAAFGYDAAN